MSTNATATTTWYAREIGPETIAADGFPTRAAAQAWVRRTELQSRKAGAPRYFVTGSAR